MKLQKREKHEPISAENVHGISRRTLARGTAWAAPVVAVAYAAPAYAASPTCFDAVWTEAIYSGAHSPWAFCFKFANCAGTEIKVTKIETFTTWHAPATNGTANKLVNTELPNVTVPVGTTLANPVNYCPNRQQFDQQPFNGATELNPSYYNDFPPATDGKIDCVAKNAGDLPRHPADADYPDSCKRLAADATFVIITFTAGGNTYTKQVNFDATVGCRVVAGCQN
jgi:hypothetical protein